MARKWVAVSAYATAGRIVRPSNPASRWRNSRSARAFVSTTKGSMVTSTVTTGRTFSSRFRRSQRGPRRLYEMAMGSGIVQFREDEDALEYLRERGVNPNEFGREAFEAALRRLRAEEKAEALEDRKTRLPRSVEEMVRGDRDDH